jgi:NAD(P)-dependent dehydrogenase (short-subunit alcohol dehydrogenase family)
MTEELDHIYRTNLRGTAFACNALNHARAALGSIVNVPSAAPSGCIRMRPTSTKAG